MDLTHLFLWGVSACWPHTEYILSVFWYSPFICLNLRNLIVLSLLSSSPWSLFSTQQPELSSQLKLRSCLSHAQALWLYDFLTWPIFYLFQRKIPGQSHPVSPLHLLPHCHFLLHCAPIQYPLGCFMSIISMLGFRNSALHTSCCLKQSPPRQPCPHSDIYIRHYEKL